MRRLATATLVALLAGCSPTTGAGGSIQFTASGESLVLGGYPFPPSSIDDASFVDGWEVKFTRLLVTLDHLALSEEPDTAPTDQSRTGKKVAQIDGPWAVDLHRGGPLMGKGGGDEQAIAITSIDKQNLDGDAPFDETRRYAFGFDLVPAAAGATRLNLDPGDADYAEMVQAGYSVLYVGTATWKGSGCTSTGTAFDFSRLPSIVTFRLGFKTPASYINCQNPDNDPAQPLGDEEHERGIQVKSNAATVAQVTVHTDHPFWESVLHDTPAHFDHLAALSKQDASGDFVVTSADTVGVNFSALRFGTEPLPWRSCLDGYTPPNQSPQMGLDSATIPRNPSGDPSMVLRDLADYLAYNQSTQGHLNADGLCFVARGYPSPY